MIIGTAGHIDHGKTTLLKALTGIDTDRLAEEKRRGISIDIGFAHMQLGEHRVGFIDVPGHERFVKNMLAGIGGIHVLMLVVAADESVMPQTVEHFEICRLLEIPRGIIVLTKKSLVEPDLLSLAEIEVRELVEGSALENAPLVAVDSVSGEGIDQLRSLLEHEVNAASSDGTTAQAQAFRLPIDRVFTIRGFGTVVTGTPCSGRVAKGDSVEIHPSGRTAKVRGIEIFNEPGDQAQAGQRTALNLSGVQKHELERGMVVSAAGTFEPTSMVDVLVHLLPSAPQPLKMRQAVRFHHGSAELMARIYPLGPEIAPGESGLVQIRLQKKALCCPKDHFVLRRYSPLTTIGGGVVLDAHPAKHRRKDLSGIVPGLQDLASRWKTRDPGLDAALVEYAVRSSGPGGIELARLVARTGMPEEHIERLLQGPGGVVFVSRKPTAVVFKQRLDQLKVQLSAFLGDYHRRSPLQAGVSREELKERFLPEAGTGYFQALLELLEKERLIRCSGSIVSLPGHSAELSTEQEEIREQLLEIITGKKFQPPTLQELTGRLSQPAARVRDVYFFLIERGELVRVAEDLVLPARQLESMERRLKRSMRPGRSFSVAEFKNLFGITRKYAIPLLEFLDRRKVTRREGDRRVMLYRSD